MYKFLMAPTADFVSVYYDNKFIGRVKATISLRVLKIVPNFSLYSGGEIHRIDDSFFEAFEKFWEEHCDKLVGIEP